MAVEVRNDILAYESSLVPTADDHIPDIEKVRELIGDASGAPYPISISVPLPKEGPLHIVENPPWPYRITKAILQVQTGSCRVAIQKLGSNITGMGAIDVAAGSTVSVIAPNDGTELFTGLESMRIYIAGGVYLSSAPTRLNIDIEARFV